MLTFTDEGFKADIRADIGSEPEWESEAFTDLAINVQDSIARIVDSNFMPHRDSVRGFVFDVATGKLDEVTAA